MELVNQRLAEIAHQAVNELPEIVGLLEGQSLNECLSEYALILHVLTWLDTENLLVNN